MAIISIRIVRCTFNHNYMYMYEALKAAPTISHYQITIIIVLHQVVDLLNLLKNIKSCTIHVLCKLYMSEVLWFIASSCTFKYFQVIPNWQTAYQHPFWTSHVLQQELSQNINFRWKTKLNPGQSVSSFNQNIWSCFVYVLHIYVREVRIV